MSTDIAASGCRIWIPHTMSPKEISSGNADVHVFRDGGAHYIGTLYTPENLQSLLQKFQASGECADGCYFFDPSMLVVRDLRPDTIRRAIEAIIQTGEIERAFERVVEE
jgi:hypothetical protein